MIKHEIEWAGDGYSGRCLHCGERVRRGFKSGPRMDVGLEWYNDTAETAWGTTVPPCLRRAPGLYWVKFKSDGEVSVAEWNRGAWTVIGGECYESDSELEVIAGPLIPPTA